MRRQVRGDRTLAGALIAILCCVMLAAPADAAPRHQPKHVKSAKHHSPAAAADDLGRPPRPDIPGPLKFTDSQLEPLKWSDLDGWANDDHAEAFKAFRAGCRSVIARANSGADDRPVL